LPRKITGFSEEIATLILGSRKPILFVEGSGGSLDQAIYRACYPDWTVIPRGSCEEVIHAVVTMRANSSLTRIDCAGFVDSDAYDSSDETYMASKGISIFPVSEIENLLILPDVIESILRAEGFTGSGLENKKAEIFDDLFSHASDPKNQDPVVVRYCHRRIDRTLKKIDLSESTSIDTISNEYSTATNALDIHAMAELARSAITDAITNKDAAQLLKWYEYKGILAIACKAKGVSKKTFEQWIVRSMRNETAPAVSEAIRAHLPDLVAS
jgi:hypothetical protein